MNRTIPRSLYGSSPILDALVSRTLLSAGDPRFGDRIDWELGNRISDQQIVNIRKLVDELQRIRSESEVTEDQVQTLVDAISSVFDDTQRPAPETVQALVTTVKDAREDGTIEFTERLAIVDEFQTVLDSANIDLVEFQTLVDATVAIVDASNIDRDDLNEIAEDLAAIRDEFLANRGQDS